jgi:hypothetical protein
VGEWPAASVLQFGELCIIQRAILVAAQNGGKDVGEVEKTFEEN